MSEQKSIDHLNETLAGQLCWLVRMGHGSMLTIEFGEPYLTVEDPRMSPTLGKQRRLVTVRGHWHLFISSGNWHLCDEAGIFADPLAHGDVVVRRGMAVLDGQRLDSITREGNDVRLHFDLGTKLVAKPPEDDAKGDILTLFEREVALWTAR